MEVALYLYYSLVAAGVCGVIEIMCGDLCKNRGTSHDVFSHSPSPVYIYCFLFI